MSPFIMLFFIVVIVFSAIIHEYSHGWVADMLGDPTARYAGRLTLNPRAHLDLWGSIILPLLLIPTGFLFAYAKPVPYNPYNLKAGKWGPTYVAIAGPISNLIVAFVIGVMMQVMAIGPATEFLYIIVYANVLLAVFNLLPIPPLDGSKVLFALLPAKYSYLEQVLQKNGFIILIIFIMFGYKLIIPPIQFLTSLASGWMGFL